MKAVDRAAILWQHQEKARGKKRKKKRKKRKEANTVDLWLRMPKKTKLAACFFVCGKMLGMFAAIIGWVSLIGGITLISLAFLCLAISVGFCISEMFNQGIN